MGKYCCVITQQHAETDVSTFTLQKHSQYLQSIFSRGCLQRVLVTTFSLYAIYIILYGTAPITCGGLLINSDTALTCYASTISVISTLSLLMGATYTLAFQLVTLPKMCMFRMLHLLSTSECVLLFRLEHTISLTRTVVSCRELRKMHVLQGIVYLSFPGALLCA